MNPAQLLTGPTRRSSATPSATAKIALCIPYVLGNIELQNVKLAYPTWLETNVSDGFSLFIEAGSTAALVGRVRSCFLMSPPFMIFSGCGESTIVSLLYDLLAGTVKLDFHDVTTLNVHGHASCSYVTSEIIVHTAMRKRLRNRSSKRHEWRVLMTLSSLFPMAVIHKLETSELFICYTYRPSLLLVFAHHFIIGARR